MATEEIQISQLELADEVLADMVLPVDTATDTKAVTLRQLKVWLGSSLPTGFIIPAVGKISDERFTLLDGKTLSRTGTYEAFCNKVVEQVKAGNWFACSEEEYNADVSAYGQCGRFVVANDYVRIPKITRFIGATITLSEIGKSYAESLPNIKVKTTGSGDSSSLWHRNLTADKTGLARGDGQSVGNNGSSVQISNISLTTDNPTYQEGAKVQPDHIKFPYYMVISTEGQTASIEIDINRVYEDLELKANSNLSNVSDVTSSFREWVVSWCLPDYNAGIETTVSTYTAPSKGWLYMQLFGASEANSEGFVYINGKLTGYIQSKASRSGGDSTFFVPMDVGDVMTMGGNINKGKKKIFYPMKGV